MNKTKKKIALVAIPVAVVGGIAGGVTAWIKSRWTRRAAAKGGIKILRFRPARKGMGAMLRKSGKAGAFIFGKRAKRKLTKMAKA
ncbi:MAG: hypothetical protein GF401_09100 [Chitinivibrionales bacterium]|nr:hypothetical protein [Chitinivibrionales bacterium]